MSTNSVSASVRWPGEKRLPRAHNQRSPHGRFPHHVFLEAPVIAQQVPVVAQIHNERALVQSGFCNASSTIPTFLSRYSTEL